LQWPCGPSHAFKKALIVKYASEITRQNPY
jgi:hypothetical protein